MKTVLRVDVSKPGAPVLHAAPIDEYAGLGGRSLSSTMISREVPADCHPLGPENKLVLAPGLLCGTAALCSGRLSVGCKSPLTGAIAEAGAMSRAAHILARLGYAAIILEGQAPDDACYILRITRDGAAIAQDDTARMLTNYELMDRFFPEYGRTGAMISIGTAGEMRLAASSIALTDVRGRPTNHARHGGVGAVMGAKGVKAILVDGADARGIAPVNRAGFKTANKALGHALRTHSLSAQGLPAFGTGILVNLINEMGAFPTHAFRQGKFANAADISGESLSERLRQRGGRSALACCRGCPIKCSGEYHDAEGAFLSKRPAYDALWAHGANCGVSDLDAIARMDRLDDDYGLDPVELGNSIAMAMEAGLLPFGDSQGAEELLHQVGNGTPLGRILGAGAETTAKVLGIARVPVLKGQALGGCDPRRLKAYGTSSTLSPIGPEDAAWHLLATGAWPPVAADPEGAQALEPSRRLQRLAAVGDTLGLCRLALAALLNQPESLQPVIELLNSRHGWTTSWNSLLDSGEATLARERAFNKQAGFSTRGKRLPRIFTRAPLPWQDDVGVPGKGQDSCPRQEPGENPLQGEVALALSPRALRRFSRLLHHGFLATAPAGASANEILRDTLEIEPSLEAIKTILLNSRPVEDATAARVDQDAVLALSGLPIPGGARFGTPRTRAASGREGGPESQEAAPRQVRVLVKVFDQLQDRLGPRLLERGVLVPCDRLGEFLDGLEHDFWRDCGPLVVNGRVTDPSLYQVRLPQTQAPILLRARPWPADTTSG